MPYERIASSIKLYTHQAVSILPNSAATLSADIKNTMPSGWLRDTEVESIPDVIARIWRSIEHIHPRLYTYLQESVSDLCIVVNQYGDLNPRLLYVYKEPDYQWGWVGSLPVTQNEITAVERRLGIPIPKTYRKFLAIHNGFLLDGDNGYGPRGAQGLCWVSDIYDEDEIIPSACDVMLEFCDDGAANEQCFDTQTVNETTYDWDHEVRGFSHPMPFWDFLFERISQTYN